jgi:hypothetical protein
MANAATLFEVPIGNSGKVTVTEPAAKVYLVTFASPPDNRLTTVSINVSPKNNTNHSMKKRI